VSDIIIDANVVFNLFKESVQELPFTDIGATDSPTDLFKKITYQRDFIFFDGDCFETSQIYNEWKNKIPKLGEEWFSIWSSQFIHEKRFRCIKVTCSNSNGLLNDLYRNGFPRDSIDKWYVRTAKDISLVKMDLPNPILVTIITDDLDFFDPNQKGKATGKDRIRILRQVDALGIIPNQLTLERIGVNCIANYLVL